MEINLHADPEFRKMVQEEVRCALTVLSKDDALVATKEGVRRIVGAHEEKVPGIIKAWVAEKVPPDFIKDNARSAVREIVREVLFEEIKKKASAELAKFDVRDSIQKSLSELRVQVYVDVKKDRL